MATSRRKPRKKSNATLLAYRKFRWLDQISVDPRLSPLCLRACMQIAFRCSFDNGGAAVISQGTIAKKLGAWREAVSRALQEAVALGHLEAVRRGRNKPSSYRMLLKDEGQATEVQAADDVCKSQTSEATEAADDVTDSVTSCGDHFITSGSDHLITSDVIISSQILPLSSPGLPSEAPGEGVRARASRATSPTRGAPPPSGGPPPRQKKESKQASKKKNKQAKQEGEGPSAAGQKEGAGLGVYAARIYADLRALWARPWTDNEEVDRRAYAEACKEVTPETILEAAKIWVTATDNPRYLPSLAKWLGGRSWEKQPPAKARQSRGNGGGNDGLPRSNGKKVDLTRLALQMGGYVEDEDGNLYHPDGNAGSSFDWRAGS